MWKTASSLIAIVLLLVALGIVMLASTSAIQGEARYDDPNFFVKRQVAALAVGFIGAVIASRIHYRHWKSFALFIGGVTVVMLIMAITPGVGIEVKGSSRWLRFGPVNVQPSELAKLSMILLVSWWLSRVQRRMDKAIPGLVIPLGIIAVFAVLIILEPDFGTTFLVGTIGVLLLFVGGARIGLLAIAVTSGAALFTAMIMQNSERMRRIIAFLNPEKYAEDEAFQLLHAIYAFVLGGPVGTGLGHGLQKRFYLPEAHTDFIFAIVGEELGLPVTLAVVLLFVGFFICGLLITIQTRDMFGRLVAFGITTMISLQAAFNIGVVTGSLPTKGLPLPLISYGGTNAAVTLFMIGILVNIAIENAGSSNDGIEAIKDRSHTF